MPSNGQNGDAPATHRSVGEVIRRRREELGISREELEARLGGQTRPGDVMRLETMRILMPSWTRLQQISETLDLPVDALLRGVDGMLDSVEPSEPAEAADRAMPDA